MTKKEKNGFLRFYFLTYVKRHLYSKLKVILVLAMLFSGLMVFSTISVLNGVNQDIYVENCTFSNVVISSENSNQMLELYDAEVIKEGKDGGSVSKINLITNQKNLELDNTIVTTKNLIKKVKTKKTNKISLYLSYNTCKRVDVKTGDVVRVYIYSENVVNMEPGMNYLECELVGYYKPVFGDLFQNEWSSDYGMGYMELTPEQKEMINQFSSKYIGFDVKHIRNDDNKIFKENLFGNESEKVDYIGDRLKIVFPIFSVIMVSIFMIMELKQMLKRNEKVFAIINLLGVPKKLIHKIIAIEFFCYCFIAMTLALPTYKYILMGRMVGQYVPNSIMVLGFVLCLVLAYIAIKIYLLFGELIRRGRDYYEKLQ